MPTKNPTVKEVTDQAAEILADARKEAAGQRLLDALRAESGQRQAEARAADPDDPMTDTAAGDLADQAATANDLADTVIAAAGVEKSELLDRVKEARKQELTASLDQWRKTLVIHESYLADPGSWGGVDIGGSPINADEQNLHVKTYIAAIVDAETELANLG